MIQEKKLSRRSFLKGALASAAIVGFDMHTRRWLDWTGVQTAVAAAPNFPTFDGTLYMDPADSAQLDAAADDFGHMVSHRPLAVLDPGSINDVVVMVQFAKQHDIKVSARGQGHSTQGQAQNEAGVVINMSTLNTIHSITATEAHVQGGVTWFDLAGATTAAGFTPPTLTDYVHLSVGGTLAVGGIGGQGFAHGPQVDNVNELTVVTGNGNLVTCSATQNDRLFDAVRAGLGQVGIIVEAKVKLVPAPATVRFYNLPYLDVNAMMADQEFLIGTSRFDYVEGFALDAGGDSWIFILEAVKYNGTAADDATVLAGLNFLPGGQTMEERPFFNPAFDAFNPATFDFVNRVSILVDSILKPFGLWAFPHPWFNAFLPTDTAYSYLSNLFSSIVPSDLGPGSVVILYPFKGNKFNAPLLMTPDGDKFFTFALLKTVPPVPPLIDAALAHNAQLRDGVVAADGKRYAVDSVPMDKQDWHKHFQPQWGELVSAKQLFDPNTIMTPGQGIF
ncbi:MAG: FAD-binding protein [Ardenticatenaceae bacterium]|nr:FAD-binding protein [Ardenticatenaceae bacterium]